MPTMDSCQKALSRAFEITLTEEVIPGILHNFANPLNGVMGRSKLLQRKLENGFGSLEHPAERGELYGKLLRDVELIGRDTDKLSDLLKQVAEKFCMMGNTSPQRVNLSEVVGTELRFFDFYLDFKHSVRKTIQLSYDLPTVTGIPAEFSLGLWGLLRQIMLRLAVCSPKEMCELYLSTDFRDGYVMIRVANTAVGISESGWASILETLNRNEAEEVDGHPDEMLLQALFLLKKYGSQFRFDQDNGLYALTVFIPVS